jgi:hypothetical protein
MKHRGQFCSVWAAKQRMFTRHLDSLLRGICAQALWLGLLPLALRARRVLPLARRGQLLLGCGHMLRSMLLLAAGCWGSAGGAAIVSAIGAIYDVALDRLASGWLCAGSRRFLGLEEAQHRLRCSANTINDVYKHSDSQSAALLPKAVQVQCQRGIANQL